MARVVNPVDIERGILDAVTEVARGVDEYSRTLSLMLDAQHAFDLAWARAYEAKTGPVEERKQRCVLATEEEQRALNIATVAHKYVDRRLKAAESRLSAYQTLSKSVTAMYGAAGQGEY